MQQAGRRRRPEENGAETTERGKCGSERKGEENGAERREDKEQRGGGDRVEHGEKGRGCEIHKNTDIFT